MPQEALRKRQRARPSSECVRTHRSAGFFLRRAAKGKRKGKGLKNALGPQEAQVLGCARREATARQGNEWQSYGTEIMTEPLGARGGGAYRNASSRRRTI